MLTHAEKMDTLLFEVLDYLPASQTSKVKKIESLYTAYVYLSARVCACVLSAALANSIIIIVMSWSLQVIVRYNTQREREQAANRGYFTVD